MERSREDFSEIPPLSTLPLKQGLKLGAGREGTVILLRHPLSTLPLKQGLKHRRVSGDGHPLFPLSTLPLKQGLKLLWSFGERFSGFDLSQHFH